MLGSVYLFDTKLKKTIRTYKDKELYDDNNSEFRLKIKNDFLDKYNNRYILLCSCNSSVELSIDSLGRIYHKNKSDVLKHDKFCERHKHYLSNISKGVTQDKDILSVTLNFNVLPNNELKEDYKKKIKKDSINLQELSKHLNIKAAKYKIDDKFDMLNRIYHTSKYIHIKGFKNKTLKDFYFNIKNYKKINSNSPKFIYMYVSEILETDNSEYVQLKCEYAQDKYFNFVSHKDLFYKEYLSKYISKSKNPIVVTGFIHKTENGLEFYHLSLIKVNKDGIY